MEGGGAQCPPTPGQLGLTLGAQNGAIKILPIHRNIIFGKIDIRILLLPSYVREVWDYSSANAENIQKAVQDFDWEKAFWNLSVDRKIDLLNETLLNILRNYIPDKKTKFNHCQPP